MKQYLNLKQLREKLPQLAESTIYKMTALRKIPHIKIGSRLLFDEIEIQQWLEKHRVEVPNEAA